MPSMPPRTTAKSRKAQTSGSSIVAALEAAYAAVRENHPELPAVVFITGTGLMGRGAKWGHYWRDRWVDAPLPGTEKTETEDSQGGSISFAPGRLPEVFIAGERLACGAEDTFETILHEAAHALAVVRDVKDTSRDGRYHNRRYLALAEELGLEFADETPHPVIGFSNTRLTEATIKAYRPIIRDLERAIRGYLNTFKDMGLVTTGKDGKGTTSGGDAPIKVPGKPKADRNYLKLTCGCGRVVRASRKTAEEDPITCGRCGTAFAQEGK